MILDYLFNNMVNKSTISELYRFSPFVESKRDQYAGSVIQYGFILLAKIDTSIAHDDYSKEHWLSYKEDVFYKLCELITLHGTDTFLADESAITLHKMTSMLTSDLKHLSIGSFSTQLSSLLSQLYLQSDEANTQNFANSLWAWGRLNSEELLPPFDQDQINYLVSCFHDQLIAAYPQSISNILWALAKLNECGRLDAINASEVHDLIAMFYSKRANAIPKELSNAAWAIAKLNESGLLLDINSFQVCGIITEFHSKCMIGTSQANANTLWAAVKLFESGQLAAVNTKEINTFVANLHVRRQRASSQELCNTLWAIAKLIEIDKFTFMNTSLINDLVNSLCSQRVRSLELHLPIAIWALGIISTQAYINIPTQLVSDAFYKIKKSASKSSKNQILIGIALLGLAESYDMQHYIDVCRPVSELQFHHIAPYIDGAIHYELEACISGFFVDLLVVFPNGKKLVVEFDGVHHQTRTKKNFDAFRDKIISQQGIEIVRVQWNENNKIFFPTKSQCYNPVSTTVSPKLSPNSNVFVPAVMLESSPLPLTMTSAKGLTKDAHVFIPTNTVKGLSSSSDTFTPQISGKTIWESPKVLPTTFVPEASLAKSSVSTRTEPKVPQYPSYAQKAQKRVISAHAFPTMSSPSSSAEPKVPQYPSYAQKAQKPVVSAPDFPTIPLASSSTKSKVPTNPNCSHKAERHVPPAAPGTKTYAQRLGMFRKPEEAKVPEKKSGSNAPKRFVL